MYKPLPNDRCTRVLRILPSELDTLLLEMTVIDVDKVTAPGGPTTDEEQATKGDFPESFDALSYTWGAPVSGEEYEREYGRSADVPVTIIVDSVRYPMKIGRNLFEALSQIRQVTNERNLWVDAICIWQDELKEKETQVLLMSDIYTKARRVIVWLGRDIFGDFEHIIWLHETLWELIAAHIVKNGPLTRAHFGPFNDEKAVAIYPMNNFLVPDEALAALYRFYATRRYFSRAWVVQEVALSKDCYVLLNEHLLGFGRVATLPNIFGDMGGMAARYIRRDAALPAVGGEVSAIGATASQVRNWERGTMQKTLHAWFGSTDETSSYLAFLEYLMSEGRVRLATEPRDLVYSSLGIAKYVYGIEDIVNPDYTSTTEAIFTHFTGLLLYHLPHRTVLSLVTDKPVHGEYVKRLPSWVPDFATNTQRCASIQAVMSSLFRKIVDLKASLGGPSRLDIVDNKLHLSARRCAVIDHRYKIVRPPARPGFEILADAQMTLSFMRVASTMKANGLSDLLEPLLRVMCWGEILIHDDDDFRRLCRRHLTYSAVEPRLRQPHDAETIAVERALIKAFAEFTDIPVIPTIADLSAGEKALSTVSAITKASKDDDDYLVILLNLQKQLYEVFPEYPHDAHLHERMCKIFFNDGDGIDDFDESEVPRWRQEVNVFNQSIARRIDPRVSEVDTFFITDKNNVGRTAATLQPGDELWLLCRAKVPFILRPVGDEYQLVGEAYVQGAMQGELITNGVAEEVREIVIV